MRSPNTCLECCRRRKVFWESHLSFPVVTGEQSEQQTNQKKGTTMNSLTQFIKITILPLLIALTSPTAARADAVTDWNLIASTTIVVNAGQPPPVSVLHFAMVHGAVYDAVNAIDRGHQPYLGAASFESDGLQRGGSGKRRRLRAGFSRPPVPNPPPRCNRSANDSRPDN